MRGNMEKEICISYTIVISVNIIPLIYFPPVRPA